MIGGAIGLRIERDRHAPQYKFRKRPSRSLENIGESLKGGRYRLFVCRRSSVRSVGRRRTIDGFALQRPAPSPVCSRRDHQDNCEYLRIPLVSGWSYAHSPNFCSCCEAKISAKPPTESLNDRVRKSTNWMFLPLIQSGLMIRRHVVLAKARTVTDSINSLSEPSSEIIHHHHTQRRTQGA